jgi:hypothetical protein
MITQGYVRFLSPEDRLIYGAGLTDETARCVIHLIDAATVTDEAGEDLMEALAEEDFTALCQQVRQATGLADAADAALAMLARMPALAEMLPPAPQTYICGHNARTPVLAALGEQ